MNPLVIGQPDNEVLPTHPLHNISPKAVLNAYIYFEENNYDLYCEQNDNGIWGKDSENGDKPFKNGRLMSEMSGVDDMEDSKCDDDESFRSKECESTSRNS